MQTTVKLRFPSIRLRRRLVGNFSHESTATSKVSTFSLDGQARQPCTATALPAGFALSLRSPCGPSEIFPAKHSEYP